MDMINWPVHLMQETAQRIKTDNETLLNEHIQQWQKIEAANTSLPLSMQEPFRIFHTSLESHLSGALTLHHHIGQMLSTSANLAETTDTAIAQSFNGFSR